MRKNSSFSGRFNPVISVGVFLGMVFGLFFASSVLGGFEGYDPGDNLSGTGAQQAYDAGIFGQPGSASGITHNADGSVTVNGYTFDPMAVARAILAGAFDDTTPDGKQFQEMLKAYAIDNPNSYENVTPKQLMEYLGNVTQQANMNINLQGFENAATDYDDVELQTLKDAATAVGDYVNAPANSGSTVAEIQSWSLGQNGSASDEENSDLGLWYDASAGNIKYMNKDGQRTNIVCGDATGYMKGMKTSSSDTPVCEEAFGADGWLDEGSGEAGAEGGAEGGSQDGSDGGCSKNSDCPSGQTCQSGSCKALTTVSPTVTNETNATQTTSAPTLAVSTNRAATCQYSTASFTYGNGTTFDTTGQKSHTYKLNSLTNGSRTYYVICKDNETAGVSSMATITFTVDLSKDPDNAPKVKDETDDTVTSTSMTLKVSTNVPSDCQYNESGGFTYGNGTAFSTTGNYLHNTALTGLSNGTHNYYVICKCKATNAISTAILVPVAVNLADPVNAPEVKSITGETQTSALPVLAVTTDIPAACQYKQGATFDYGSGSSMTAADDGHSHSVSISSLTDGAYNFYVSCKSNETAAVSVAKAIATTLDRPDAESQEPKIEKNTAGYQTVADPVLSVKTDVAATCQYKTSSFTYGNGTPFSTTGSTIHNVELGRLENGTYSYYVVCKASSSGVVNAIPYVVGFTVDIKTDADDCADLSSNDRQSDGDRSDSGGSDDTTNYLWQAVESGKRESFSKVDWFAGYQFSLNEDGYATELCGYFAEGETNEVILFNGSYKDLAKTKVTGTGAWECADIDKVKLSADTRYYVITQVKNQSINYEYESGFLPVDTGKAVIEAGIRQSVNSTFNKDIVKYDYMIFGLVDVKISYVTENTKGPKITSVSPSGNVDDSDVYISVDTDNDSKCRFGRSDEDFNDMKYILQEVSDGTYSQRVCDLEDGDFTFYVRCADEDGKKNDASTAIEFKVED